VERQRGVADLEFDLHTDISSMVGVELQQLLSDLVSRLLSGALQEPGATKAFHSGAECEMKVFVALPALCGE